MFSSSDAPVIVGSKRRARGPVMAAKKKADRGESSDQGGVYKSSVNLPTTNFGMRANSSVKEPEIQKFWEENMIFEKLQQTNTGGNFTLHDGPPYANGDLHMGHALNKILKDIVNKYQILQGKKVNFIPGWDCHGLPIELKVLQSMDPEARKQLTPIKLRKKAAQFALKTVEKQKEGFKRFGVWASWSSPYLTLNPWYEAAQIDVFGRMLLNGHIYRGKKPVHWSPSSGTALAEAELEYPEGHVSRSVYVALPVREASEKFPEELKARLLGASLAIWTTTPWTMPANAAVAVNERLSYCLVEVVPGESPEVPAEPTFGKGAKNLGQGLAGREEKLLVVAEALVPKLAETFGRKLSVLGTFLGSALEGTKYVHPLYPETINPVVIGGDYITTESGTGLVHTAPGHGQEDYQTGLKYGLPLLSPVDNDGLFTEEAGPQFEGLSVLGEGNVAVIEALNGSGALLLEEGYAHKYPYDWRTKKPTIFRATEQWFASVDGFRSEALAAISTVQWVPPQGENRITSMTVGRSDWCISRQRSWGLPIPVFYHKETGEFLMNQETISHVKEIFAQKGSDAWFQLTEAELLPPQYADVAHLYRRGTDTMDVWFDSGSSWAAVLKETGYPADLYLEGSDQHRGWFQSSLLTSVAANGCPPYKRVLTHGFVLDSKGLKMSKSLGNVVDPKSIIDGGKNQKESPGYGADVLRLWVSSVDYSGDVLIGPLIMRQLSDTYRKLRGTLRYLLGNLHDFKPEFAVPYDELPSVDKYALWRLSLVAREVKDSYESFQFYKFYQAIQRFVVVDLSNFYFDVCKDRLYVGGTHSFTRRSSQTVLSSVLGHFLAMIAPVLPHTAEDAWQNLPGSAPGDQPGSVFQALWPALDPNWGSFPESEVQFWGALLQLRTEVNRVAELARTSKLVGANLDAKVYLYVGDAELAAKLAAMDERQVDSLTAVLLVSQVELVASLAEAEALGLAHSSKFLFEGSEESAWVGVGRAEGSKCERCWHFSLAVGTLSGHPTLCARCHTVVESAGVESVPAVSAV